MGSNDHYCGGSSPARAGHRRRFLDGRSGGLDSVNPGQFPHSLVEETGYRTVAERAPSAEDYPRTRSRRCWCQGYGRLPAAAHVASRRQPSDWWATIAGGPAGAVRKFPESSWEGAGGRGGRRRLRGCRSLCGNRPARSCDRGRVERARAAAWRAPACGGATSSAPRRPDDGRLLAGAFPQLKLLLFDGFDGPAPSAPPSRTAMGSHDMIGNIWRWTTDWYQDRRNYLPILLRGESCDTADAAPAHPEKGAKRRLLSLREIYQRYRPAARIPQLIDTGTCHQGFPLHPPEASEGIEHAIPSFAFPPAVSPSVSCSCSVASIPSRSRHTEDQGREPGDGHARLRLLPRRRVDGRHDGGPGCESAWTLRSRSSDILQWELAWETRPSIAFPSSPSTTNTIMMFVARHTANPAHLAVVVRGTDFSALLN